MTFRNSFISKPATWNKNPFVFCVQAVPDRPVGLHRSLLIVAWIEWKLVMLLKGKWKFRSCDSKTKSYTEQLANTRKLGLKGGKYVKYNPTAKVMEMFPRRFARTM